MTKKKTAYLITTSKAITPERLEIAKKLVKKLGYKVKYSQSILDKYLFYAGTPKQRAEEINTAYTDKETKYIFNVAGGMGAVHTLPLLDFDIMKNSKKIFVGYSDVTILLNAINQKTEARCLHGPNLGKPIERFNKRTLEYLSKAINKEDYSIAISSEDVFREGVAEAQIVGGNLRLLVRSLGTNYEINTDNKIVFLEADSKTEDWVFDMLWQLKLAGKLDNIQGIIFGYFTECGKDIKKYLEEFFKDFTCPIIFNQSIGHNEPNITIPIGETCIIDTEKKEWKIRF